MKTILALVLAAAPIVAVPAAALGGDGGLPTIGVEMRATWYGPGYVGRRTASGERFDPHALTAAHPSLPLGSSVVVRAADGRSVAVRINDRAGADVIDLSPAAARALHLLGRGGGTVMVMMSDQVAESWIAGE